MRDAMKLFEQRAYDAECYPDYSPRSKNRMRIILMSPDDFLSCAKRTTPDKEKAFAVDTLLTDGVKFNSVPQLYIHVQDGQAQVTGHEGRHRAFAIRAAGYQLMPVYLVTNSVRWSEQDDPAARDYVKQWPKFMVTENGERVSFPLPRSLAGAPLNKIPTYSRQQRFASESASQVLYHFTQLRKGVDILNGEMKLTPAVTHSDKLFPEQYFLSMTRSRTGRYHRDSTSGVMFELDGRKLNQKYKIVPVDYWKMRSTPKMRDDSNEMEERLLANRPSIKLLPYITKIYLLAPIGKVNPYLLRTYSVYARKLGIPLECYTDFKDFQAGNKSKSVKISELASADKPKGAAYPRAVRRSDPIFGNALYLLRACSNPDLNLYSYLRDGKLKLDRRFANYVTNYQRDLVPQLEAAFHNAMRSADKDRSALDRLLTEMRKHGLSTAKGLADFFIQRYNDDWKRQRPVVNDSDW